MRWFLPTVSLCLACGSTAAVTPPPPGDDAGALPDTSPPPVDDAAPPAVCPDGVVFQAASGKIQFQVGINGTPYSFILDTGAPNSVADFSIQAALGSGPYQVTVGDATFKLAAIQFDDIQTGLNVPGVVGVIGADVFGKTALTLDYPRGKLWLQPKRDEASLLACTHVEDNPAEVPFVNSTYLFVEGKAEDASGFFLVDTGASFGAMPDTAFDMLDAAHPRNALRGFYTPAAAGTFWARLGSVGSYEVGGKKVSRMLVRTVTDGVVFGPTPPEFSGQTLFGVLPSGFLHNFMVTVDYPAKMLRLDAARNVTPADNLTVYVSGIGIGDTTTDPPVMVVQVLPKSSAEEQGVQVGDRLLTINGASVDTMDPYTRPWRLSSPSATTTLNVVVQRNGTSIPLTLQTRDLLLPP